MKFLVRATFSIALWATGLTTFSIALWATGLTWQNCRRSCNIYRPRPSAAVVTRRRWDRHRDVTMIRRSSSPSLRVTVCIAVHACPRIRLDSHTSSRRWNRSSRRPPPSSSSDKSWRCGYTCRCCHWWATYLVRSNYIVGFTLFTSDFWMPSARA
jgi:hypothetical protein